jgi:TRAP-type C4-dicarboxylate transport system substrate-binding protein
MRLALAAAALALSLPAAAQTLPSTQFNVVGTIGNLSMYTAREVPFWNERIPQVSNGAIRVQLRPFTELGMRGPEIFRLVSTGTLQLASTVLNYNSGEVPMNEAADLVGLFASVEELQKGADAIRAEYARFLEARHGIKLLGFGTYQAQVIYCRDAFTQVADLRGRKVRASGASQQAFVNFLGGSPVTIAFAEVQPALASGVVDCAITGALSGYRSRWHESARFISPMPVNFGLVAHLANLRWWNGLDANVRALLERELRGLEDAIFEQAKTETATGIACNTGTAPCPEGAPAAMRLVPLTPADEALRKRAFEEAILPAFAQRCGAECVRTWNATIGPLVGVTAR